VGRLLASSERGVVLAGAPGVGKTRLGHECLKLAEAKGYATATVMASRSSVHLPLGAMAPLLPPLTEPGPGPADLLRRTASAIAERGSGRPVALLVDDAHWLDDHSATLVEQLVGSRGCFVVATVRSGQPTPDPIVALWKNDLVERLEVLPLDDAAVAHLLQLVLGGGVEGMTLRRLGRSCGGNALYLRELVLGALDSGALVNEGDLWRLTGPPVISQRLLELLEERLGGLAVGERNALELTAFGEPLEVAFVEAHSGPQGLDALERRGLVTSFLAGRRLQLRLAHPLYGEVLLSRLPVTRVRAIKRALADWVEGVGVRRSDDPLRFATWRLDGGGEVRGDFMLAGAQAAHNRWDLPLAERLAGAAADAGGGFGASLMIAHLAWLQGRCEEAEQRLVVLVPQAVNDLQRTMLASIRMDNLFMGMGRTSDALVVGEAAEALIGDQACRDEITSQRARVLYLSGHTREAEVVNPAPAGTGRGAHPGLGLHYRGKLFRDGRAAPGGLGAHRARPRGPSPSQWRPAHAGALRPHAHPLHGPHLRRATRRSRGGRTPRICGGRGRGVAGGARPVLGLPRPRDARAGPACLRRAPRP